MHTSPFARLKLFALPAALALTGCASNDYEQYSKAQSSIAQAQSATAIARYTALERIAASGDTVARVAATMALAGVGGNSDRSAAPGVAAPTSPGQVALQWASILVPSLTQAYMIGSNVKLGMRQSDNATKLGVAQSEYGRDTAIATKNAFVGIASKIQAPAAHMTLSGTGVLGSGAYSIGANSGSNSGNAGRMAGGAITDNTSTPTVVTQPAPVTLPTTDLSTTTAKE